MDDEGLTRDREPGPDGGPNQTGGLDQREGLTRGRMA